MKKLLVLLACFSLFVALPITRTQAQTWVTSFLRDVTGNVYIDCKSGVSSDTWQKGFKRDSSGYLDANCSTSPAPSPTPTTRAVAAYSPTMMYQGTGTGGGGGNVCTGSVPCVTNSSTPSLQSLGVRYIETLNGIGSTWDPSNTTFCKANNVYCYSVYYLSFTQNECADGGVQDALYSSLDSHYVGSGNDPGFAHTTTPVDKPNRAPAPHSGNCGGTGKSTLSNPADPNAAASVVNVWLANAARINSATWRVTMLDNSGDIYGSTTEYGAGSQAAQLALTSKLWNFYAQLSPYLLGTNSGGPGGSNYRNNTYDASHITFAATNHIVNDVDGYCRANPGNFKFILFERPVSLGSGSTDIQNNLPYLIDTTAEIYSQAGCANTDVVGLDAPYNGSGDSKPLRLMEKIVQSLLQPNNYDGSVNHRAYVKWLYNDCTNSCLDMVPVMPEDTGVFVPTTSYGPWTEGAGSNGTGCYTGDNGGAKDLLAACMGTDINGATGAVFRRNGEWYVNSVDKGPATIIVNDTNQTITVQNSWCSPACNTYTKQLDYSGSGPVSGICTNANCNGTYAEIAANFSIPACPAYPTVLTAPCGAIYLQQ